MTISGCSMPRLASASWKRGSATIAFPASSNSSMWIAGWTPGTSRQSTRRRSSSETIASCVIPSSLVRTTRKASRGGVPGGERRLRRLAQLDRHEPHPLAQVAGLAHDGDRCDDLVPGQRIERLRRDGRRGQRDTRVLDWLPGWTPDAHSRSRRRHSPCGRLHGELRGTTAVRAAAPPMRVGCLQIIDRTTKPFAGGYRRVLGVIAAPPAYLPQVVRSADPHWPFWEKAGMVVRADSRPIDVSVPANWRRARGHHVGKRQAGGQRDPVHAMPVAVRRVERVRRRLLPRYPRRLCPARLSGRPGAAGRPVRDQGEVRRRP